MPVLPKPHKILLVVGSIVFFLFFNHFWHHIERQRYTTPISTALLWFWRKEAYVLQESVQKKLVRTIFVPYEKNEMIPFSFEVYNQMASVNNATLLLNGCARKRNSSSLSLITGFINLYKSTYRETLGKLSKDTEENNLLIEARHMEVIDVLQSNLNHKFVNEIHVLVRDREAAEYLHSLPLQRSEKLVLRVVNEDVGLKCQLLYAAKCLPGQLVAITNQDNKIGKGWDLPWRQVIGDSRTMYALTRHSEIDSSCTRANSEGTCDEGQLYLGSHDTFVFKVLKEWTENTFIGLEGISPDLLGMENFVIWFFQTKLNYLVLNPCKLLFIHHHHCVPVRSANRQRVNSQGKSSLVGFSRILSI
eukprot:gene9280-16974_t